MKYTLLATTALAMLAAQASAQTVSRTDLANASSLNVDAGLASASSTTLSFQNDGATLLVIRSTNGGTVTATVVAAISETTVADFGKVSLPNQTVTIPANSRAIVGPFPTGRWNDAAGLVNVTITSQTNVSATAIRAGR